jgi:hypothetical protein
LKSKRVETSLLAWSTALRTSTWFTSETMSKLGMVHSGGAANVARAPARGNPASPGGDGVSRAPREEPGPPPGAEFLAILGQLLARYVRYGRQSHQETAMDPVIPIADLQSIYSVAEVERAAEDGAARRNEGLKSWYERMRELGGSRYIIKPSTTAAVDDLAENSPNFTDVIDDLRKSLALAISGHEAVQFLPILLLGEPGLGKTHFAKRLANALGTGYEFVSMNSLTAAGC